MSIERLRSYRVDKVASADEVAGLLPKSVRDKVLFHQNGRFELQFRFAVVALRLEIRTGKGGSCLMMTSRKKAPAPMSLFRKWGFKARTKVNMLKKVEEWAAKHGIVLAR